MDEDPVNRLIQSAREAEGKRMSQQEEKDGQELQEFELFYQREHAIAYLQRKMPYHYFVYKRLILEIQKRAKGFEYVKRLPGEQVDDEDKISVLDYGAGLGSGLWAAMHCYG